MLYLLLLAAMFYSIWAQHNVTSTFNKYSQIRNSSGMTGYDAARLILDKNGLRHVSIERIAGNLTDHYDPKANVIRLSDSVYSASTSAAVGVAAHEAGHAVQHAVGYFPIKIRMAIVPICNFGSRLAVPLVMIGLLVMSLAASPIGYYIAMAGVIGYGLLAFFQFVTLPVEFNASGRALEALRSHGRMAQDELDVSKKVLTAAALTYVAAFAVSLLQFLRLLSIVAGSRDRRR